MFNRFIFLLWHIWKNRNTLCFQQQHISFSEVIQRALNHHDAFFAAQDNNQQHLSSSNLASQRMAPPQPLLGSLVISFDATVDEQRNYGSITILACNHLNHACGWYCKRIPSIMDPLTLETLAGRESVILSLTKGFNYVSFEGDCYREKGFCIIY